MDDVKKLDCESLLMNLDDEVCRLFNVNDEERTFANSKLSIYHMILGELFIRSRKKIVVNVKL